MEISKKAGLKRRTKKKAVKKVSVAAKLPDSCEVNKSFKDFFEEVLVIPGKL